MNIVDRLDAALAAITPGPYFFDSYSRVMSSSQCKKNIEWSKENIPDDLDDPSIDWRKLAGEEPRVTVFRVPVAAGDTSTEQGAIDAKNIVTLCNLGPELVALLREAKELVRVQPRECYCEAFGCHCGAAKHNADCNRRAAAWLAKMESTNEEK